MFCGDVTAGVEREGETECGSGECMCGAEYEACGYFRGHCEYFGEECEVWELAGASWDEERRPAKGAASVGCRKRINYNCISLNLALLSGLLKRPNDYIFCLISSLLG